MIKKDIECVKEGARKKPWWFEFDCYVCMEMGHVFAWEKKLRNRVEFNFVDADDMLLIAEQLWAMREGLA